MPKERTCYRCDRLIGSEKKKQATLTARGARARSVEVCRECWWYLIAHGSQLVGSGREVGTLTVSIEQRDLFADEVRPAAKETVH